MNEQNVVSWMIAGGDHRTVKFSVVRAAWRTLVAGAERLAPAARRHAAPVPRC